MQYNVSVIVDGVVLIDERVCTLLGLLFGAVHATSAYDGLGLERAGAFAIASNRVVISSIRWLIFERATSEEERGKMLFTGEPSLLDAATVLKILVSATDKLRDHLRGLVPDYLDDGLRLQELEYEPI